MWRLVAWGSGHLIALGVLDDLSCAPTALAARESGAEVFTRYNIPRRRREAGQGDEYEQYFVTEMYPRTLAFDTAFAPVAAGLDAARVRQAEALRRAAVLSSSLALKLLTEDLAGAAPERRVAFLASVDAFQTRWRAHFGPKLASMRPLTVADYDTKPAFAAAAESPTQRWSRILLLLAALAAPFLIALVLAWRGLRRAGPL